MSKISLINDSSIIQNVDAIVNAANNMLYAGGGVCGAIFSKAGYEELTKACKQYAVPLQDGQAVITPAFNIFNANYIIHAVGPNFNIKPNALKELYMAYYNCLKVLKENNLTSISFPLISAGIFGGNLENPVATSTVSCLNAYDTFTKENPYYDINVLLCAYSKSEFEEASQVFSRKLERKN